MGRSNWAQYGFNAGELSPKLEMRDDVAMRKLGASLLSNWQVNLQGSIETIRGLEFITEVDGTFGRLYPFPVNEFTAFAVCITTQHVTVINQNGLIPVSNLFLNGDFLDGSTGWTATTVGTAQVLFSVGSVELIPGIPPTNNASIKQEITVTVSEDYTVEVNIADGVGDLHVKVGSAEGLDDIYADTAFSGISPIVLTGLTATTTSLWVEVTTVGGDTPKQLDSLYCMSEAAAPVYVQFTSPWTESGDLVCAQAEMAPGTFDLYMTGCTVPTQVLHYNTTLRQWTFGPKTFTNPPAAWGVGNYPKAIGFFQGRLYLGGTPNEPDTFWATRPGENTTATASGDNWDKYTDFRLAGVDSGTPDPDIVNADHAIEFTLERKGDIRWIMAQKNLVIGTENAEHIVTAQDGVVQPGDIQSVIQSTFGSSVAMARNVGNQIVFISSDKRKLRAIGYQYQEEQWVTKDLTFFADHITKDGNHFHEVHYAANPGSFLQCPTGLGQGVACAYDTESRQGGFFRKVTQGYILSICVVKYGGVDQTWVVIDRKGDGTISVERTAIDPQVKLESFIRLSSQTGPTMDWSAPHLANQTCQAVTEDFVHPDVEVAADGSFTTQFAVEEVIVGLPIYSEMETMSLGTLIQYVGTGRPMKKRFNRLFARLVASWYPLINGRRPPTRHPGTPMGETEPARTETIQVSNLGWDLDGKISIIQDLPVHTEIVGLFGELSQEQL